MKKKAPRGDAIDALSDAELVSYVKRLYGGTPTYDLLRDWDNAIQEDLLRRDWDEAIQEDLFRVKASTQTVDMLVAGVPVHVTVDGARWPLYAIPRYDAILRCDDEDHRKELESKAELAAKYAFDAALRRAKRSARKANSDSASTRSAEARRKKSDKHLSNEWFRKAHEAHPEFRKSRLAQHARQLAAAANIELAERNKITVDRAQQFLDRLSKPSQ